MRILDSDELAEIKHHYALDVAHGERDAAKSALIEHADALAARVAELEQLRDGMAEFYGGAVRDAKRYRWLKEYYQRVDIDLELMGVAPDKFDAAFDAMCSAVADSERQS